EHMAAIDNPAQAVTLDNHLKRRLGIGNSTGLGMAPFIVNHPTLLNNWILARETALARVRSLSNAADEEVACFIDRLHRQITCVDEWCTDHERQQARIQTLQTDLQQLLTYIDSVNWHNHPWQTIYLWAEQHLSHEGQECLVSLMLEPYAQLVDELSAGMSIDESQHFTIDGRMSLQALREVLTQNYQFASAFDTQSTEHNARFWYASEEKLEPRLGERYTEDGAEREHPLATARDINALQQSLADSGSTTVAEFLIEHPQHRHSVRRVQQSVLHPYSEVTDNLISSTMLPIDLLRCKLSFFGAVKFDPRSDRWVRITMYQHAPTLEEIGNGDFTDDWIYPPAVMH
ncbi:MAG: hypothetical protein AAF404_18350, partial [Pseudomonadota bacterium]